MKYQRIAGIAAVLAIAVVPIWVTQAQSTRADDILNRNADRQADLANRDQERLDEIAARGLQDVWNRDSRFRAAWIERIVPQITAASQDAAAVIYPITGILDSVSFRLDNIITVLQDAGVPTKMAEADILADYPDISGLTAYNLEEKYNNFLNCYDGSGGGTCLIYQLPASGVNEDTAGLKAGGNARQLQAANADFITRIGYISAGAPTGNPVYGTGYPDTTHKSLPFNSAFMVSYAGLRGDATTLSPTIGAAPTSTRSGVTLRHLEIIDAWDPTTYPANCIDDQGNTLTGYCYFWESSDFEAAVQMQVSKLRNDLTLLRLQLGNTQQAVRAFVYDVLEALEFVQKTADQYSPFLGNEQFSPDDGL